MDHGAFIDLLSDPAQELQIETNVFPSVTIAQGILETGFAVSIPIDINTGQKSYNLFGVKGTGPAGTVQCWTPEERNGVWVQELHWFKAYHNFYESIVDHASVLLQSNFAHVRRATTPEDQCRALISGVEKYATDSRYADKLIDLINYYDLKQYDLSEEDIRMIKELANRVAALEKLVQAQNDQTVSDWAKDSMQKATSGDHPILHGDEHGNLFPKAPLTTERAVVILDRAGLLK